MLLSLMMVNVSNAGLLDNDKEAALFIQENFNETMTDKEMSQIRQYQEDPKSLTKSLVMQRIKLLKNDNQAQLYGVVIQRCFEKLNGLADKLTLVWALAKYQNSVFNTQDHASMFVKFDVNQCLGNCIDNVIKDIDSMNHNFSICEHSKYGCNTILYSDDSHDKQNEKKEDK